MKGFNPSGTYSNHCLYTYLDVAGALGEPPSSGDVLLPLQAEVSFPSLAMEGGTMRDAENIRQVYFDLGYQHLVTMGFRGRNAFWFL